MLLAHPAVNPEVQGSNLALDIFCFVTNFFYRYAGWGFSIAIRFFLSILNFFRDHNTSRGFSNYRFFFNFKLFSMHTEDYNTTQ